MSSDDLSPNDVTGTTAPVLPGSSQYRFVEPDETEKLPRAPKAHHKKSRNGCRTCRSRRVKCDEEHPTCGNCRRRQMVCIFDTPADKVRTSSLRGDAAADTRKSVESVSSTASGATAGGSSISESRNRRQLELRLLNTYNTRTCHTLLDDSDLSTEAWVYESPKLALENDALLNALFSFTALHLIEMDPSCENEMKRVHHKYWHMALQGHTEQLQNLSPANFNVACMTSTFIRLNASVMLQDRQLSPYTPPTEWFHVTRGAMHVFEVTYPWMSSNQGSIASRLTESAQFIWDEEEKFGASKGERFSYLSGNVGQDSLDLIPAVDRDAYEKTINYIGGICITMEGQGCTPEPRRRLLLLPYLVPGRFAELLDAARPRALVILAHYFALFSKYRANWWMGATGAREVRAMAAVLPQEWQPLMSWPLSIVDS